MNRTSIVLLVVLCGCAPVTVPSGFPPVPEDARSVYVSGGFGDVRRALVADGFVIEDADAEAGFLRTGTFEVPQRGSEPTLLRVYASDAGDGLYVLRGEYRTRALREWYEVRWESHNAKRAFLKIVEVAMAIDSASVEVRAP